MAALLEKLERQPAAVSPASAEQYRGVVRRIGELLAEAEPDAYLHALLEIAPATAELYENLRYEKAGLCLSPLERATEAELATAIALRAAAGR